MRDYMVLQEGAYSVTTYDLSGMPAAAAFSRVKPLETPENVCVNGSDPRGLMHPRTFLLMLYRADAVSQLYGAGRIPTAAPPDDWEELIKLLAAHAAAVAEVGDGGAAGALPEYGLCITTHADCGRLGDVWAAIAASMVQTAGTTQGVYWDLTAPPPSATPLVNSTGWQYATDVLRRLLQYNAPDFDDGKGGVIGSSNATASTDRICTDVSPLFANGSCMITLEWDAVFSSLTSMPPQAQLSVAPLPGSRRVMDRRSGSATAGKLVNCSWELCAVSANHDLLYLNPSATALRMDPLAPNGTVLVTGKTPKNCDIQAVMQIEAAAVAEVLASQGVQVTSTTPVNRAPYSAVLYSYARFTDGVGSTQSRLVKYLSMIGQEIDNRVGSQYALKGAALASARAALGYLYTNASSGDALQFVRTRWWTALGQPFDVRAYVDINMSAEAAQAFMRASWHAMHSPNGATDATSPIYANFIKWALGNAPLSLEPSQPASVASVTASLLNAFQLVNDAFTESLVRDFYATATNSVWQPPSPRSDHDGSSSSTQSTQGLIALLVGLLVGLGAVVLALAALLMRFRRRQRDILGRVRAPRVDPDTSLLVSDVQNSTVLWEELSVPCMDSALKIHHSTIRKVLAQFDGYESATEGDSFIIAFATPSRAVAFASACQLALLQQDWPAELLAHPDGAVVAVDPRDTTLRITSACAAADGAGKLPVTWRPFCTVVTAWQRLRRQRNLRPNTEGESQRSSAGAVSPLPPSASGSNFDLLSRAEHEEGPELQPGDLRLGHEGRGPGSAPPAVVLEMGTSGYLDSLAEGLQSQATVSDDRFSMASTASRAGLGGSGLWWLGASSTWGKALAAAFPLAATAGDASTPRVCKSSGKIMMDRKLLAYRGLRIRMGIHSGLDDPQHMVFNKVGSAFKYYGPFAETAKLVSDAAPGGLVTLSGQAFARLRNGSARGGGGSSHEVIVVYAGHYVLSDVPVRPKPTAAIVDSEHIELQAVPPAVGTALASTSSTGPDEAAGGEGVPLFLAVPSALLCRLPHSAPLRALRATQLGSLAAPTGTIAIAFMKVVGASTLLADLPGPASRALEQFARLAGGLLGEAGGYVVEGGDGLLLAAFSSPLAGVEWALDCVAGLRELEWEEELLAHELCEEVVTVGAAAVATGTRAPAPKATVAAIAAVRQLHPLPLLDGSPTDSVTTGAGSPPPDAMLTRVAAAHGSRGEQHHAAVEPGPVGESAEDNPRTQIDSGPRSLPTQQPQQQSRRQTTMLPPTRNLKVLRRSHERGLRVKVGLDVGAVTYSLTEASGRLSYRGKVMNRAARIAGTAAAGQVLCSGAVWLACEAGMALGAGGGVVGVSLGRIALKGISAPVEVVQCSRG